MWKHRKCIFKGLVRLALVWAAVLLCSANARAEDTDLRLRIAWGGGESRQWRGVIQLDQGSFADMHALGLEADEPGSIVLEKRRLLVDSPSPRSYDGVDVTVRAPLEATLVVDLAPLDDAGDQRFRKEMALSELVTQFRNLPLDDRNNRLLVRRAPGDQLRLKFDRDTLVFSPGEAFAVTAEPHLTGIAPNSSVSFKARLLRAHTDTELWTDERELRVSADGTLPPVGPLEVEIPSSEGVYDLVVELTPWRFPTPFRRAKPVVVRRLQLVVIESRRDDADETPWRPRLEIDPANPGWWDRLKQLSQLKLIPAFAENQLSSGTSQKQLYNDRPMIELAPGAWHAYPLPIGRAGQPHILEVEYPGDVPQTLGISIVEPNASGVVVPIGLDSGVDVPEPEATDEPGILNHRLIFWPRTKAPFVLLVNRRSDRPAVFGKLRVLDGPQSLPPAAVARDNPDGRLLAAVLDKPLFPENFGAGEALDEATGRSLDDWATFYLGGKRLVEYLKHVGYNGAVVAVACEGSALYPSMLLDPTPKYDTGIFLSNGEDARRKDVLEMLLRLFDREGLTLVPSIQFAGPLPALEEARVKNAEAFDGLEPVDHRGKTWIDQNGTRAGLAPYYNPLNDRVQQAMADVVEELAARYGHHRAFGGVALQLGPDTYAQLPGEMWCYDDTTIAQFQQEWRVKVPGKGPDRFSQRARYLRGEGRQNWLTWRTTVMARFYESLQAALAARRSGARLFLSGGELFTDRQTRHTLRPTLPPRSDVTDVTRQFGLDPRALENTPGVVMLRPQRHAPLVSLSDQALNLQLRDDDAFDEQFAEARATASLHIHEPLPLRLESFEERSPFGKDRTQLWMAAHVSPSAHHNRRRFVHSIATLDPSTIFDGGWMIPLGQEDALRELVEVYRRLPAERFQTATPRSSESTTQPVVVRTLVRDGRTFIYLVNDAPWPVTVELDLNGPRGCRLEKLGQRRLPPLQPVRDGLRWRVALEPYDLVGAALTAPNIVVNDWQVTLPAPIEDGLRTRVKEIRARAMALTEPQPMSVLSNPGFEQVEMDDAVTGWIHARGRQVRATADAQAKRSGTRALRLDSQGDVLWVRSQPFEPPRTGRVSVMVWLKIADASQQPPLRLAVEGRWLDQRPYYRWQWVGKAPRNDDTVDVYPLKAQWAQYLFHVDNLPLTGLTELRVGFDLMGAGRVWIDDVQVFDRWFYENERDELLKSIVLANFQIEDKNPLACHRFLDSYWPRFLLKHVGAEPRVAENTGQPSADDNGDPPVEEHRDPSVLDRLRGLMPKRIFPF